MRSITPAQPPGPHKSQGLASRRASSSSWASTSRRCGRPHPSASR